MRCPNCGSELRTCRFKEIVLDFCLRCGGIWFDPGEIKVYSELLLKEEKIPDLPTDIIQKKAVSVYATSFPRRPCPRCQKDMQPFNFAYNSNIMLDRCPHCQGIWADREEIIGVASYLKGNPQLRQLGESLLQEKRKLSPIEDLADLVRRAPYLAFAPRVVLPLYDKNPVAIFPWVTVSLIAINTLIFILQFIFVSNYSQFFFQVGLIPAQIMAGQWNFSLLTSIFIHGGFFHLFGNMLFFWIFGDNIEDKLGHFRYLIFYLICGILAGLTHLAFNPHSSIPCVGASGAISGLMGGYLVLYPRAKIRTFFMLRVIDIPAYFYIGSWVFLQIVNVIIYSLTHFSNVAWFAHLGGFAAGSAFLYYFKRQETRLLTVPSSSK